MRIVVFGATGRTGARVVHAARARGLSIAAFVRDAQRDLGPGVELHVGDVGRAADVAAALQAGDAVISCLGGIGTVGIGTANIVNAMVPAGARRFVGVVGAGVLQHDAHTRRNEQPDYPPGFRAIGSEHQAAFDALRASPLSWSLVCTPRLVDGDPTGKMLVTRDYLPDGSFAVTTGDVANLLVDEALAPEARGRLGVNTPSR